MSQRPITGYLRTLLSGGEILEVATPTAETPPGEPLSSTPGDQSGGNNGIDNSSDGDRSVNHAHVNPESHTTDISGLAGQPEHDDTVHNRSLTDMLESAFNEQLIPNSDIASSVETSLAEEVIMLESQLIHKTMELDRESREKTTMQHQIDLLQAELEKYKKIGDKQRQEIKKLSGENDDLKRDLSKHNGMRRFTSDTDKTELIDELQCMKAKFHSLKEHMMDVTNQIIGALEETPEAAVCNDNDDTLFTIVAHSKRGRRLLRQKQARAHQVDPQPQPQRSTTPALSQGQPIPVVCGMTGLTDSSRASHDRGHQRQPANTPSRASGQQQQQRESRASHVTGHHQQSARNSTIQSAETIVIGTSLTRGLGAKLNALGTNVTCYTYAGSMIPEIRSRIPYILPSDNQPRRVVIQCGGNDAESQPSNEIIKQYDNLIGDIQRRCPRASVILSKIPPRRKSKDVLDNISRVNIFLQHRATEGNGVWVIDVCPHDPAMYRKDLVHFNVKGCRAYAKQMHSRLLNFTRLPHQILT